MRTQDTIHHYALVIRQNWRIILITVLLCSALTCLISLCLPQVYQANALVKVHSATTQPTGNDVFSAQAAATSYAVLVTSPEVFREVAQQLSGMTQTQLEKAVTASPVDNSQLIQIRAQANTAEDAAHLANTVAAVFIQVQETKEATRLQASIDQLAANLATTRLALDTFGTKTVPGQNTQASNENLAQQKSQLDAYQATYTSLLNTYNQLQTQKAEVSTMFSIVQTANPPTDPASPLIALNTLLAFAMSLVLVLVFVLVHDWLDTTIKTGRDLVQFTRLGLLGSIPARHITEGSELLDLTKTGSNKAREAYMCLGSSFLELFQGEHAILVTGLHPHVGVTTTATYLALSLAQTGKRVLLIDANIQQPRLHDVFVRPNTRTIVESLRSMPFAQQKPDIALAGWLRQWKTHIPNLWLLPAGTKDGSATPAQTIQELQKLRTFVLDSSENTRLIDVMIFDAPVLEESSLTTLLTSVTSATVLVVQAGKEHKETLQTTSQTLQRLQSPILGVVINRQQPFHHSYFYLDSDIKSDPEQKQVVQEMATIATPSVTREKEQVVSSSFLERDTVASPQVSQSQMNAQKKDLTLPLFSIKKRVPETPVLNQGLPDTPQILPVPLLKGQTNPTPLTVPREQKTADHGAADQKTNTDLPKLQFGPLLRMGTDRSRKNNNSRTA